MPVYKIVNIVQRVVLLDSRSDFQDEIYVYKALTFTCSEFSDFYIISSRQTLLKWFKNLRHLPTFTRP